MQKCFWLFLFTNFKLIDMQEEWEKIPLKIRGMMIAETNI